MLTIAVATLPVIASAQSAVDAYNMSQTELRGTARFMSMGGAFTALGGDLSTLNQNPAGIGVYRRSEIGATLDISPTSIKAETLSNTMSRNKTNVYCNNFGYVGTSHLDGAMSTFSWGFSYNRAASFDRTFNSYELGTNSSLSNYIATFSNGADAGKMTFGDDYNPYFDSDEDWLSILAYNSYLISPRPGANNEYNGLFTNGTEGNAYTFVRETGCVDEYSIDFGGNVGDVVYWGIGFGITDLNFNRYTYYSESMTGARVESTQGTVTGDADFVLENNSVTTGSGWNFKAGLILRPVNELRIGLAIHTPTWYNLNYRGYGETSYSYYNPNAPENRDNPYTGEEYTDDAVYGYKLNAPWKFMVGLAGVLGDKAIISVDYERQMYDNISIKYQDYWNSYVTDEYVKEDIQNYYKASNIIRVGAEYRVTPRFSVRAGYNYTTTNVKDEAANGQIEILTAGTNPAYTMNRDKQSISFGLGYRYKSFYIDGAYIYKNRKSTYHAYTSYNNVTAPVAQLTETTHSAVVSVGFKF